MGGFIKAVVIWFIGLITLPIIITICDAVAPEMTALGWDANMVNLTIYGLKYLWGIGWLIMGIVVWTNRHANPEE